MMDHVLPIPFLHKETCISFELIPCPLSSLIVIGSNMHGDISACRLFTYVFPDFLLGGSGDVYDTLFSNYSNTKQNMG